MKLNFFFSLPAKHRLVFSPQHSPFITVHLTMRAYSGQVAQARPYAWPHDGSLESTALIVIDMQRDCKSSSKDIVLTRPRLFPLMYQIFTLLEAFAISRVICLTLLQVCEEGGYLTHQGYSVKPVRSIIPAVRTLLDSAYEAKIPVIHTREGHLPNLSDLPSREKFRSRNNPSGKGIGDSGPMGRFLIRGESGHDTIPELYPRKGDVRDPSSSTSTCRIS